jgi:hypothetical protein
LQNIYPINKEILNTFFEKMNIIPPESTDWSSNYPIFDATSIGQTGATALCATDNCLGYALGINGFDANIELHDLCRMTSDYEKLMYVVQRINDTFSDNKCAKAAPFQKGSLPKQLEGYYIIAFAFSAGNGPQDADFHLLRQNRKVEFFSHRRGCGYNAEATDSDDHLIFIPEFCNLKYTTDEKDYDYKFIGYIYIKCDILRLKNLSIEIQRQWQDIEKMRHLSSDHEQLYNEFMANFLHTPLPEFFSDTRELVSKFYLEMQKLKLNQPYKNNNLFEFNNRRLLSNNNELDPAIDYSIKPT